jgi:5-methylcytosine-specific restriction endonuclease McrA
MCGDEKHYEFEEMEADHIVPWRMGGHSTEENCQMLCMHHNRTKSGR